LKEDKDENSDNVLDKLVKAGIPKKSIVGDRLARNFILQGGTVSLEETKNDKGKVTSSNVKLNKGLNYSNDIFNGAYGWGGISERGFVPMPGITNVNTTYFNNGALSKAVINIQCFSKTQFQLLDVLYLRPGYSLLLEFGWSTYLSSKEGEEGTLQTYEGFKSAPLNFLLNPQTGTENQFEMLQLINDERKKHSCNYEAVYGRVVNFKWNFESNGSYKCEITLIGLGSVIESLKLNVSDPKKEDIEIVIDDPKTLEEYIIDFFGSAIGQKIINKKPYKKWSKKLREEMDEISSGKWKDMEKADKKNPDYFYNYAEEQYKNYTQETKEVETKNSNENPLLSNKDDTKLNKVLYNIYQSVLTGAESTETNSNPHHSYRKYCQGIKGGAFMLNPTITGDKVAGGGDKAVKSVYIKFACLLKIIQKYCNLYTIKPKTPMMKFDFLFSNMAKDRNFMLIIPPNISSNPGICLTEWNKTEPHVEGRRYILPQDTQLNNVLKKFQNFTVNNNKYVGRLGNILLNLRFVAKSLAEAPIGNDGSISVLSYIKTILDGINEAMGGINNFIVIYDEDEGVIKILDETPKPGLVNAKFSEFSTINVFGVKQNMGSFVTNIGLDAQIPKNFATQVAIGAAASGNNLQGNATSFSMYNAGLIDRVIPEKNDYISAENNEDEVDNATKISDLFTKKIYYKGKDKISPFGSVYRVEDKKSTGTNINQYNFTPETTKDLTENYTSYIQLVHGALVEKKRVPSPFFLPFNLSLEIEGMSGMRLFEKFRITDDILPPSYEKNSVDIIVKGLNHTIDTQKWSTTIDTLSVPRHRDDPLPEENVNDIGVKEENTKQEALAEAAKEDEETGVEDGVRMRVTRLCDDKRNTMGLMEVLDESGNVLYGLPTSELPWDDNKNNVSCIPTGTYTVASRISKKHGECFLISEKENKKSFLRTGFSATGYNTSDRTWVLIHAFPRAHKWAMGCIGPGFVFNMNNAAPSGNPDGTGTEYGGRAQQSYKDSQIAVNKLLGSLWNTGKAGTFKLEIKALGGGSKPTATKFNSVSVQNKIGEIENKTGEKYTYKKGKKGSITVT